MKFFVFVTLAAAASATIVPAVNTGSSAVSRSEDGLGNYAFGYNEDHATGGTFRKEQGGPGYMSGSYGLRDADGRMRTVNYVADALGYRASISTNEPGTDVKQDPAAADFNLGAAGAALVAPAAPAVLATKTIAAGPVLSAGLVGYANRYAAPIVQAPVYGAPAMALGSSYSTAINHVSAPVLSAGLVGYAQQIAAPVLATKTIAAPVLRAPIAIGNSYSTAINHISGGLAAPVYAAKAMVSPIALGNSYSTAINHVSAGLSAPVLSAGIVGHSAIVNRVAAPVLAAPLAAPYMAAKAYGPALATSYSTGISHLSSSPVVAAKQHAALSKYL